MTCFRPEYGLKDYPPCSGHGTCIENRCVCDKGWIGIADMQLTEGFDCDINLQLVVFWSIANIILLSIGLFLVIYWTYQEINFNHGKVTFDLKLLCFSISLFQIVVTILIFTFKALYPEVSLVGSSKSIYQTILVFCSICSEIYLASAFLRVLVKFLESYSRFLKKDIREWLAERKRMLLRGLVILPTIYSIEFAIALIICSLSSPSHSDKILISLLYIFLQPFVSYCLVFLYILNLFIRELKVYVDQNPSSQHAAQVKEVCHKFRIVFLASANFLISGFFLEILFASWPFLRRKFTFLLMFQGDLILFATLSVMWTLRSAKKKRIFAPVNHSNTGRTVLSRATLMDMIARAYTGNDVNNENKIERIVENQLVDDSISDVELQQHQQQQYRSIGSPISLFIATLRRLLPNKILPQE